LSVGKRISFAFITDIYCSRRLRKNFFQSIFFSNSTFKEKETDQFTFEEILHLELDMNQLEKTGYILYIFAGETLFKPVYSSTEYVLH